MKKKTHIHFIHKLLKPRNSQLKMSEEDLDAKWSYDEYEIVVWWCKDETGDRIVRHIN